MSLSHHVLFHKTQAGEKAYFKENQESEIYGSHWALKLLFNLWYYLFSLLHRFHPLYLCWH